MTTGKNKEQFEEWYVNNDYEMMDLRSFYNSRFEMQIGVLLAYYDSLDQNITVEPTFMDADNGEMKWMYTIESHAVGTGKCGWETRNEAYKEAFKKANELINKDV